MLLSPFNSMKKSNPRHKELLRYLENGRQGLRLGFGVSTITLSAAQAAVESRPLPFAASSSPAPPSDLNRPQPQAAKPACASPIQNTALDLR